MSLSAGQIISLSIEKPAAGGPMIARAGQQIVLVSGAIPGERAAVRITRIGKGVAYGEVVTVEERSSDRRELTADPLCGGCLYAHISYPRQVAIKSQVIADAFGRIGKIAWDEPIPVAFGEEHGYRMRARLHLRHGRVGFFREGTHEVCDARRTRQLLPESCDVLDRVNAALGGTPAPVEGELEISEDVPASTRALHLETAGRLLPEQLARLTALAGVDGLTLGWSGRDPGEQILAGDPRITDVLDIDGSTVTLRRHVLAFFQGNRFLLTPLVRRIVDCIERNDEVVDLYAGVGLFSVAAAVVKGARVTAVEGDRVSSRDLTANAAPLGGLVDPVHRSVEEFTSTARQSPAVVIVDPPRTGLSRAALDGALRFRARTLAYVSCDVATLARDARRMLDAGYHLESLQGFDLFPNTPHVEAVAVFRV